MCVWDFPLSLSLSLSACCKRVGGGLCHEQLCSLFYLFFLFLCLFCVCFNFLVLHVACCNMINDVLGEVMCHVACCSRVCFHLISVSMPGMEDLGFLTL